MLDSPFLLARLRRIAAVGSAVSAPDPADAWLEHGLAIGRLHELYACDDGNAASAAGFATACALAAGTTSVLWLRTEATERRDGRLSAAGFGEMGLLPDALIVGVVDGSLALLKAAGDAARCAGLGMVILESHGPQPRLDLTATRRLMLAAETSGTTVVSLRIGAEPTPSAAATRWDVVAAPSRALPANAPGPPAFDIELLRRRGSPAGLRWRVEWNRDARTFVSLAPVSGARVSVAPDRAAARDALAPVRRAG